MPRARRPSAAAPPHAKWLPLARQIIHESLALRARDVLEMYVYPPAIPLAEALALEASGRGSDRCLLSGARQG